MEGLGMISKARISEVMSVVCEGEGLTVADMKSHSRVHRLAHPRQIAMALARELSGHSYPVIGRCFGERDHTTVLYAFRKVSHAEAVNPVIAERLAHYRQKIRRLVSDRVAMMGGCSSEWSVPAEAMAMLRPNVVTVNMGVAA